MSSKPDLFDANLWQKREIVQTNGVWTVEGRPRTVYKLLNITKPDNIPGKSFVALLITVPPNAATPPHNHNGAAVYGQVIKGKVISQMIHGDHDSGVGVYGPGEMWYEAPGCHHVRAENGGDEEAQFFANFIIDTEKLESVDNPARALTILDIEVEQGLKI